eukprot:11723430-Alexandrium_andersonii.AAC.1
MSASLVGSEMCIRDRCMGARTASFECLKQVRIFGDRNGGTARSAARVSYTHLTLPTICSV